MICRLVSLFSLFVLCQCGDASRKKDGPGAGLDRKDGMVRLSGGTFTMGHDGAFDTPFGRKEFPEEGPARKVTVKPFWIDETEVTNAQFARFVAETGFLTFAERPFDSSNLTEEAKKNLPPGDLKNGAMVFIGLETRAGGAPGESGWWRWDPEASWKSPRGAGSGIEGLDDHPVVCVTHEDAEAYAKWAGKRLPTEAEWEYAARGGMEGKIYTWGDELKPGDRWMANTWQGEFPEENSKADGFAFSSPVKSFPPNGYGLYDMAGNVWELCSDYYDPAYPTVCKGENPQGPELWVNRETGKRGDGEPHRVMKGGSFLCHISYCMRYRPAARHSQDRQSPAAHGGFRCVKDVAR